MKQRECLASQQGRLSSSLGEEGWSADGFSEGNGRSVGVLARIREDVTGLMQGASVLDPRRKGRGRLGRPGFAWRVELAVRNADRFLPILTLVVTVVVPMWVAVEVGVEGRYPMRRVLAVVVPIGVRDTVLMEMSQRGEGGEKDERGDLETRNHEVKKWAHGAHSPRRSPRSQPFSVVHSKPTWEPSSTDRRGFARCLIGTGPKG